MGSDDRFGRRGALVGFGLVATGAAAMLPRLAADGASGLGATEADARDPSAEPRVRPDTAEAHALHPADASARALFGSLQAGSVIEGARIEAVHAPRAGALPVVLTASDGSRFALELFRRDAASAPPLAQAGELALYLVNRGDGRRSTPEPVGLGARALARALEARLAEGAPIPDALTTFAERRALHPGGVFHVPLA